MWSSSPSSPFCLYFTQGFFRAFAMSTHDHGMNWSCLWRIQIPSIPTTVSSWLIALVCWWLYMYDYRSGCCPRSDPFWDPFHNPFYVLAYIFFLNAINLCVCLIPSSYQVIIGHKPKPQRFVFYSGVFHWYAVFCRCVPPVLCFMFMFGFCSVHV